jgi:hypothetical protein
MRPLPDRAASGWVRNALPGWPWRGAPMSLTTRAGPVLPLHACRRVGNDGVCQRGGVALRRKVGSAPARCRCGGRAQAAGTRDRHLSGPTSGLWCSVWCCARPPDPPASRMRRRRIAPGRRVGQGRGNQHRCGPPPSGPPLRERAGPPNANYGKSITPAKFR